jgi:uncharacterized membrane protein
MGVFLQSFFITLHNPQMVHGLQYLVFANHISLDEALFILPLYAAYQSPLTLILIQALILSFTSVLIYYICKRFIKNNKISFVLALAYLLNPGMQGMLFFEFHEEFLIIPLILLTFYFYMTVNKKLFYLSLILLLFVIDTVVFEAAALGLGLLYYELVWDKNKEVKKQRIRFAVMIILFSIMAFVFYTTYNIVLQNQYLIGNYSTLPTVFYAIPFDSQLLNSLFHTSVFGRCWWASCSQALIATTYTLSGGVVILMAYTILTGILLFGIALFIDPILTVLLTLPWITEIVILRHVGLGNINLQYYSYVLGGSVVAAILGLLILKDKIGRTISPKTKPKPYEREMRLVIPSILILLWVSILFGMIMRPTIIPLGLPECYRQLDSVISTIPQNVSLMTTDQISPHVTDRVNLTILELQYYTNFSFKPEFILTDFNRCFAFAGNVSGLQSMYGNYIDANGYRLVDQNGTVQLWKANQTV